ncbi:MAG: hypothetical protein IPK19_20735 [Chloroflexi bacterium]|nr:hypothetical protein [Chloroflexota bacterium]
MTVTGLGTAVSDNLAAHAGGGIYTTDYATVIVTSGATVSNNDGSAFGGGVYLNGYGTTLTVSGGATIANNEVTSNGGGICSDDGASPSRAARGSRPMLPCWLAAHP